MQTIEITVTAKGETTVQTKGFAGSCCRDASRFIEEALGQRHRRTAYRGVSPDPCPPAASAAAVLIVFIHRASPCKSGRARGPNA